MIDLLVNPMDNINSIQDTTALKKNEMKNYKPKGK